jgi:hypothetical protein
LNTGEELGEIEELLLGPRIEPSFVVLYGVPSLLAQKSRKSTTPKRASTFPLLQQHHTSLFLTTLTRFNPPIESCIPFLNPVLITLDL